MNQALVEQIAESWKLSAPPVRPSPATVDAYRAALPTDPGWCGLVQGATPEIVDLMLSHGADRVVSMELHPETQEAMRTLATRDWSRVETIVGNWCDDRPELRSTFDIVVSDGGPLFLPFPSGWHRMYEVTHRQLVPGGKTVFRTWAEPPGAPPFREYFDQARSRFEHSHRDLPEGEQKSLFVTFVSEVKSAALFGTVDKDGKIVEDRMWPAWNLLETDLRARYDGGLLGPVVSALFDRTNPVGEDGAQLVSAPNEQLFRPVLEGLGFKVDVVTLEEPDTPAWNLVVTGKKSGEAFR